MKRKYQVINSNNDENFSQALNRYLDEVQLKKEELPSKLDLNDKIREPWLKMLEKSPVFYQINQVCFEIGQASKELGTYHIDHLSNILDHLLSLRGYAFPRNDSDNRFFYRFEYDKGLEENRGSSAFVRVGYNETNKGIGARFDGSNAQFIYNIIGLMQGKVDWVNCDDLISSLTRYNIDITAPIVAHPRYLLNNIAFSRTLDFIKPETIDGLTIPYAFAFYKNNYKLEEMINQGIIILK